MREIIGGSVEDFLRYLKFYLKSQKAFDKQFYNINKAHINSLYASDFHRLQSFFYKPKWENEGKKSINFALKIFIP